MVSFTLGARKPTRCRFRRQGPTACHTSMSESCVRTSKPVRMKGRTSTGAVTSGSHIGTTGHTITTTTVPTTVARSSTVSSGWSDCAT